MGLTMLRLLLLPVFLWVLLADAGPLGHRYRWVAVSIFAVMALTDKLDGHLARRFNQTSRIGAILDPVADKLLIACSVILLSFDWVAPPGYRIPMPVVVVIYAKDLVVALGTVGLIAAVGSVTISARMLGKVATALQLALVIATLVAPDLAQLGEGVARGLLVGLYGVVSVVTAASCLDYVIQGIRLLQSGRQASSSS